MKKKIIIITFVLLVALVVGVIFIKQEKEHTIKPKIDSKGFNYEKRSVMLNSGYEMPIIGLGTWTLENDTCENSVYIAIKNGYRLIDTAYWYGNEEEVGKGVRKAIDEGIVTREELFITTKLPPYGFNDYDKAIEDCNKRLGLDYIDLMLVHQSGSDEKKLYRAIERAVDKGLVKSLGISNYYTKEAFEDITDGAKIMPAVIQNENHIFYQNTELQEYVKQYGIIIESYYPLGGRGHTSDNLNNETIVKIAKSHNVTSAQIILRWHIQSGYITIPGSSNESHIKENISIFDFELTDDEMKEIEKLNTKERYETW
ncbi:MAG: aldo/keto reductase [Clostridium sp.]|nr:aldo/keto reductase [Clostridium sp.]